MLIKPFRALRARSDIAASVACVPYDTVNDEEARALAAGIEWSFLRIVRPEIDLPAGVDAYSDEVYAKGAENFARFQKESVLMREEQPCLYIYRQQMGDHAQSGVAACCHVRDYEQNVIRRHEITRVHTEGDRARHISRLNANTEPVLLMHRDDAVIDRLIASVEETKPLFSLTAPDGVAHTVWRAPGGREFVEAFEKVPVCYIADGHHRAAAAVKVGAERRKSDAVYRGDEEYNWFLGILVPAGRLRVNAYNRCVTDLNGLSQREFLREIAERFALSEAPSPCAPAPGRINMYLPGKWYNLAWNASEPHDPVSSLDVSRLQRELLDPILGIADPKTNDRIEFVPGSKGKAELTRRVDSEEAAVAFSLFPVTVEQIMAVADAGMIMPPKSTWFAPKPRSGLFVHTF